MLTQNRSPGQKTCGIIKSTYVRAVWEDEISKQNIPFRPRNNFKNYKTIHIVSDHASMMINCAFPNITTTPSRYPVYPIFWLIPFLMDFIFSISMSSGGGLHDLICENDSKWNIGLATEHTWHLPRGLSWQSHLTCSPVKFKQIIQFITQMLWLSVFKTLLFFRCGLLQKTLKYISWSATLTVVLKQ